MKPEHHEHDGEPCSCGHDHSEHHQQHPHLEEPCSCGHDHAEHKDHKHHEHQHPELDHNDLSITHHENAISAFFSLYHYLIRCRFTIGSAGKDELRQHLEILY